MSPPVFVIVTALSHAAVMVYVKVPVAPPVFVASILTTSVNGVLWLIVKTGSSTPDIV